MAEDKISEKLRKLFVEFKRLPFPQMGGGIILLNDADIDLSEEDSYLAGLVDSFLATGHIASKEIFIDASIDERIDQAVIIYEKYKDAFNYLREYRKKMLELAKMLSEASGVLIHTGKTNIQN
ncbi:MAG: hypothetical protein HZC49_08105 [Nitrospirae bacterium]|nr:hypothetical protein [Nitrospirota bacterium]